MDRSQMDTDSDREIIIGTRLAVARLEERTAEIADDHNKLTKVVSDVGWIKKIGGGFGSLTVTVIAAIIAVLLKMRGLS